MKPTLALALLALVLGGLTPSAALGENSTLLADLSTSPPDTRIAATVDEVTARSDASFALSATKTAATFQCALDGASFTPCGTKLDVKGLAAGDHVLRVVATDRLGQSDPTPAQFAWRVDKTPPDTAALVAGPAPGASDGVAVFASSERGRIECRRDGGDWSACASPLAVPPGTTLAVRAIDAAGNVDPSPATVRLEGETARAEPTGARRFASEGVSLALDASSGGALSCRLDGGEWSPCQGPVRLPAGAVWGEHSWSARAEFPGGLRLEAPELRWSAATPGARLAALQFPVLLERGRDGRSRSRGRPPILRFALNVAVRVSVRVDRVGGRRSRPLSAWTVAGRAGDLVVRLPDGLVRRLRRGRYRISAQPEGGAVVRAAFAVV